MSGSSLSGDNCRTMTALFLGMLTLCCRLPPSTPALQHVPPERLLVFEPKQGWEPLCAFLGKPVPDQPFPHINDTQAFKDMVAYARRRTAVLTYAVPAVAIAAVALLVRVVSRP